MRVAYHRIASDYGRIRFTRYRSSCKHARVKLLTKLLSTSMRAYIHWNETRNTDRISLQMLDRVNRAGRMSLADANVSVCFSLAFLGALSHVYPVIHRKLWAILISENYFETRYRSNIRERNLAATNLIFFRNSWSHVYFLNIHINISKWALILFLFIKRIIFLASFSFDKCETIRSLLGWHFLIT